MSEMMRTIKKKSDDIQKGFRLAYNLYHSGSFRRAEECMSKALGINYNPGNWSMPQLAELERATYTIDSLQQQLDELKYTSGHEINKLNETVAQFMEIAAKQEKTILELQSSKFDDIKSVLSSPSALDQNQQL